MDGEAKSDCPQGGGSITPLSFVTENMTQNDNSSQKGHIAVKLKECLGRVGTK